MTYTKTFWQNQPSSATPLNATNLNHLETQYDEAVKYTDDELADAIAALTKSSVGLSNVDNTSDEQQPRLIRGKAGMSYRMIGCTVRYISATTWAALDDAGHAPTGVSAVTYMADRIRITYDFTASKVCTLVALPDETMSTVSGIRMGPSVGLTFADIFIYTSAGGATPINPNTLTNASANIWIWGVMEM